MKSRHRSEPLQPETASLLFADEARLRAILDSLPTGIVLCDRAGTITLANETALKLYRHPHPEGLPMPKHPEVLQLYRPSGRLFRPEDLPLSRSAREGVVLDNVEVVIRWPDGVSRRMLCTTRPLRDASGAVCGAIGSFSDLTSIVEVQTEKDQLLDQLARERARLVAQHREAKDREKELRVVLESLAEGVIAVDSSHRLVFWNRQAAEMVGLTYDQFGVYASTATRGLRTVDGSAVPREAWPDYRLMAGETIMNEELTGWHADGRNLRFSFSGSVARDDKGNVSMAVISFRDVTALRELERAKDEFLQVLAHELRNPLAAASGIIELVRRRLGAGDAERATEYLALAETELARLGNLTGEIISGYQVSSGRLPLNMKDMDLVEVLARAAAPYVHGAPDHDIRVADNPPGGLPVYGDDKRLVEAVANLLSNAVKYSPKGSRVWVSSSRVEGHVYVRVEDEGIGIPADQLEAVFEGFFRGRNLSNRQPGGLGLGLYISRDTIRRHGGDLWAENRPGGGTVMTIKLPEAEPLQPR